MIDNTYNGWSNYATWRVNLEIFDGMSPADICGETPPDRWTLENEMKEYAEELVTGDSDGLATNYALAFLSYVDWREIAQHKIKEYA